MALKLALCGFQNSGKSYGRRYIPDGENVMLIQPSSKISHLFTGPNGVEKFTTTQIDEAIKKGTRVPVNRFNISDPDKKYSNIEEALDRIPAGAPRTLAFMLTYISQKKSPDFFGKGGEGRKFLSGNIMYCTDLDELKIYTEFVDKFMPWIHTIILPDFTHFISHAVTDDKFIARKIGGEQYAKYYELAAASLRSFITNADKMRHDLIVVTEYHAEFMPDQGRYEIFIPGGKMVKEKFLPSSYYDTFLFTDVKYPETETDMPQYRFITRNMKMYPETRSVGFDDLYIPNNWQNVLDVTRQYTNIPVTRYE